MPSGGSDLLPSVTPTPVGSEGAAGRTARAMPVPRLRSGSRGTGMARARARGGRCGQVSSSSVRRRARRWTVPTDPATSAAPGPVSSMSNPAEPPRSPACTSSGGMRRHRRGGDRTGPGDGEAGVLPEGPAAERHLVRGARLGVPADRRGRRRHALAAGHVVEDAPGDEHLVAAGGTPSRLSCGRDGLGQGTDADARALAARLRGGDGEGPRPAVRPKRRVSRPRWFLRSPRSSRGPIPLAPSMHLDDPNARNTEASARSHSCEWGMCVRRSGDSVPATGGRDGCVARPPAGRASPGGSGWPVVRA